MLANGEKGCGLGGAVVSFELYDSIQIIINQKLTNTDCPYVHGKIAGNKSYGSED